MADNASWRDTHRTANRAEVLARRRDLIVKKARVIDHRGCYDVCAARASSCKDTLTTRNISSEAGFGPFLRSSDDRARDGAGSCEGLHYDLHEHDMSRIN
jgi:hypothetical protein